MHIKAGPRLYAAGAGLVQAIDIPKAGGEAKVSWQAKIEGTPHRLLAADGKLFAVTLEGAIYAFGESQPDDVTVHTPSETAEPLDEQAAARAGQILETTGATDGYALLLGVEQPQLAEALASRTQLSVIAVDDDAEQVEAVRNRLYEAGLYGHRAAALEGRPATALTGDTSSQALPPLFARLVVCDDLRSLSPALDQKFLNSIVRLLRPYGGQALLRVPAAARGELAAVHDSAKLPGVSLRETGQYVVLTRETGLPEAADWSHAEGNAANAGASQDGFLKPPLALLWYDTSLRWHRKPGSAEVRVSRGRAIVLADRLYATDVFTGRLLWDRPLPEGITSRSRIVADGDRVILASGDLCLSLDASTGQGERRIEQPEGVTGDWSNLRVQGDALVATIGKHLVCLDHAEGKPRWKFACGRAGLGVAVGADAVYCVELVQPRRGETVEKAGTKMRALDLASGEVRWEVPGGADVHYSPAHQLLITTAGVYDAASGERVRAGVSAPQVAGDRIVSGTTDSFSVSDVQSGDAVGDTLRWNRRGCTGLRSSCHLVTTRFKANAAYVDLETREITSLWNIRPGCNNNLYPAEGLLNVPNVTGGCECNYTPTSKAFAPLDLIRPR